MKIIPSVFLIICLCIAPASGQNIPASVEAGIAALKTEFAVAAQSEAESGDIAATQAVSDINAVPSASAEPLSFGDDSPQFSMLRAFGAMGLVLCLLVAAYFGVRKYAPGAFPKITAGKNLKIIETLNMGDRRSIVLVEAGGNRLLLGSTPQQINLLTSLSEQFSPFSENKGADEAGEKRNFRNLFEVEKKRPVQYSGNMLPEEVRMKMRRLREALEK